jgi:thymidylate synthase (FAD)
MIDVTYLNHMGSDLTVVNAARVSFAKQSEKVVVGTETMYNHETGRTTEVDMYGLSKRDEKLIRFLAKEKHKSPFNHAFASFHVKAPIFVARQLQKHEYMPWNEVSRRYVEEEPEFYTPDVWRGRSADKKQGSEGSITISKDIAEDLYDDAIGRYRLLLDLGVCPEQARMILPQSMMTEWHWSGSLFAFAKMCSLRCKPDTQAETREVAELINDEMMSLFPVSWEALRMYEE